MCVPEDRRRNLFHGLHYFNFFFFHVPHAVVLSNFEAVTARATRSLRCGGKKSIFDKNIVFVGCDDACAITVCAEFTLGNSSVHEYYFVRCIPSHMIDQPILMIEI